jgi:hypothetical protein
MLAMPGGSRTVKNDNQGCGQKISSPAPLNTAITF